MAKAPVEKAPVPPPAGPQPEKPKAPVPPPAEDDSEESEEETAPAAQEKKAQAPPVPPKKEPAKESSKKTAQAPKGDKDSNKPYESPLSYLNPIGCLKTAKKDVVKTIKAEFDNKIKAEIKR